MTENDAIRLASEYILEQQLDVIGHPSARYLTYKMVDEATIPPDILETYRSVKSNWKNRWVVSFEKRLPLGVIECPSSIMIYVSDDGELSLPIWG